MPTSKALTTTLQLHKTRRGADVADDGELPFVSKHARVVAAVGDAGYGDIGFAVGAEVALTRVAVGSATSGGFAHQVGGGHTTFVRGPALSSDVSDRVAHLSVTPDSDALRNAIAGSTTSAHTFENLAMLSRTAVLCATEGGAIACLATGHLLDAAANPARRPPRAERDAQDAAHHATADDVSLQLTWITLADWETTGEPHVYPTVGPRALLSRGAAFSVARFGPTYNSTEVSLVAAAHEHFSEARVFDVSTGAVVDRVYTTHGPVALQTMYAPWSAQPLLCIAEGCIASVWDVRAGRGSNACVARVTLLDENVNDICVSNDLASRNVIATATTDRNITVFDSRKWTKVSVEQNVLKYAPVGMASAGVVADVTFFPATILTTGIDSEVRAIDINSSSSTSAAKTLTKQQLGAAGGEAAAPAPPAASESEDAPLQGTFRQRLASSQHCKAAWHGAPVQAAFGGKLAAIALSTHGELFATSIGVSA